MDTTLMTMLWKRWRICWMNTIKLYIYFRNNFNRWWESGSISNTLYQESRSDVAQIVVVVVAALVIHHRDLPTIFGPVDIIDEHVAHWSHYD
jgi:predicted membrane chloride channel (bestrophin family)